MHEKTLSQDILNEIGTQTYKRLKIDIIQVVSNDENIYLNEIEIDEDPNIVNTAIVAFTKATIKQIQEAIVTQTIKIEEIIQNILTEVINDLNACISTAAILNVTQILQDFFDSFISDINHLINENKQFVKETAKNLYLLSQGKLTFRETILLIIKSLLNIIVAAGAAILEKKLFAVLSPIFSPMVANILSVSFSIVVASLAIVFYMRFIESTINTLSLFILNSELMKLEEIENLCETYIPQLSKEKEEILKWHNEFIEKRGNIFNKSFNNLKQTLSREDINNTLLELANINSLYEAELQFETFEEFDDFMQNNEPLKF